MSKSIQEAQREEREKDRDVTQAELAQMAEDGDVEQLRELLEDELHPGTVRILNNYVSRDFILSNLADAELQEFKFKLELRVQRAIWAHPNEGGLAGKARAFYLNDIDADLPALSDYEKNIVHTYKDGIWFRAKRSQDGWQQEEYRKQHSVVERKQSTSEDGGTLSGVF